MERPDDTRSLGLAYALIDLGVLLAAGLTARIAVLFVVSFLTKEQDGNNFPDLASRARRGSPDPAVT
jgi:hypothetical protein